MITKIGRLAMIRNLILIVGALMILLSSGAAQAGDLSYECTIKHVNNLNPKGMLIVSYWEKQFKNEFFSVSRETGQIDGAILTTAFADETRLVHPGSAKEPFKSIAEFYGQFQVIEIQEFRKGSNKPFFASSAGKAEILTGICN
jgi:hypothetical protein